MEGNNPNTSPLAPSFPSYNDHQLETIVDVDGPSSLDFSTNGSQHDGNALNRIEAGVVPKIKAHIKAESKAVFWWRIIVFVVLFISAVLISYAVYVYVENDELNEFEEQYHANAKKIVDTFHDTIERKLNAINGMATSITSFARATNSTFPFVTLPDFAERGADIRIVADTLILHWMPLVTDETRLAWEDYALQNRQQIDDAFLADKFYRTQQDEIYNKVDSSENVDANKNKEAQKQGQTQPQTQTTNDKEAPTNVLDDGTGYHPRIYDGKGVLPDGTGPYLPRWQRSPVNGARQAQLNLSMNKVFKPGLPIMQKSRKAVLTSVVIPPPAGQTSLAKNILISQYRDDVDVFVTEPVGFMGVPVFDRFPFQNLPTATIDDENDDKEDNPSEEGYDNRQLVGVLATNLYWRQYLTDIATSSAVGIVCVLTNSFNQTFSYQIDGSEVTFLGMGDPHDPKYDHLVVSADVNAYVQQRASIQTRSYTTVPLTEEIGQYYLDVYPSKRTEEVFTSTLPMTYTIIIAMIFLVTMIVFLLFAKLVERRQEKVMDRAIQSGAIVSSLFPEQVQDRLYEANEKVKSGTNDSTTWLRKDNEQEEEPQQQQQQIQQQLNDTKDLDDQKTPTALTSMDNLPPKPFMANTTSVISHPSTASRPIADLFPETTILFADLAGFTAWSSKRRPEEVFELLETLYAAFDRVADRRKVFKVETIGDCYLAVTGLPSPQYDHAVRMVKFARECLHKMDDLVQNKLSDALGVDTSNLKLRVGLHSGSVTAGVLRGQKSRFQLFGDTVNTASRMESTSVAGKIQVSQSTADSLINLGKSSWLIPREDKVIAKGKGEMVTYWVTTAFRQSDETSTVRSTFGEK